MTIPEVNLEIKCLDREDFCLHKYLSYTIKALKEVKFFGDVPDDYYSKNFYKLWGQSEMMNPVYQLFETDNEKIFFLEVQLNGGIIQVEE